MLLRKLLSILTLIMTIGSTTSGAAEGHAFHAVHISFTQAEWSGSTMKGRASYYKDDFIRAATDWLAASNIHVSEGKLSDAQRQQYFRNFFRVWANGLEKQLDVAITSSKDDATSYIVEFTVTIPPATHALTLDNRILFHEYTDQTNLLVLKHPGGSMSHSFTPSAPTVIVK